MIIRTLLIGFLAAVLGYTIAARLPVSYDVHFSYAISRGEGPPSKEFQYDGYYALSAIDLFTTTLAAWIASPEIIASGYASSDVPLPTRDAVDLVKHVRTEKAAPGLVRVTVQDVSQKTAEAVAKGITEIVPSFIQKQNEHISPAITFRAAVSQPWTSMNRVAPLPITLVIFIFVLLVQIIGMLLFK